MTTNKKMELPSITKQKQETWQDAENLYTDAYNQLSQVITTVGVVVHNYKQLPESVNVVTLSKMIAAIDADINILRSEINQIHADMSIAKANLTDLTDINMYGISHAGKLDEWMNKYETILLPQLHDLTDYVEQITTAPTTK